MAYITQDQTLFDLFGGIRPMARALDEKSSTVASWKREGRISAQKQPHVLKRGLTLGLPITAENVVFPLGRSAIDVTPFSPLVACGRSDKAQRKGPSK